MNNTIKIEPNALVCHQTSNDNINIKSGNITTTIYMCPYPIKVWESIDKKTNREVTGVNWSDGTKTMVRRMEGEEYNKEFALAMCISKKMLGKNYKKFFEKYVFNEEGKK